MSMLIYVVQVYTVIFCFLYICVKFFVLYLPLDICIQIIHGLAVSRVFHRACFTEQFSWNLYRYPNQIIFAFVFSYSSLTVYFVICYFVRKKKSQNARIFRKQCQSRWRSDSMCVVDSSGPIWRKVFQRCKACMYVVKM